MRDVVLIEKTRAVVLSLLFMAFGVLFITLPQSFYKWFAMIVGIVFIATGLVRLILQFTLLMGVDSSLNLVSGLTLVGFGAFIFLIPNMFIPVVGITLAIIGVLYCGEAADKKRAFLDGWWKDFAYGVILLLIGLILDVLYYSLVSKAAIAIYLGASFISYGVLILAGVFFLERTIKYVKDN